MHKISLSNISKKFEQGFLFQDIHAEIVSDSIWAITGRNGSGKSTLLQIISSYVTPDAGKLTYIIKGKETPSDQIGLLTAIAAPANDLFSSLTLAEAIDFHFTHQKLLSVQSTDELLDKLNLKKHQNKPLQKFSSGMYQKVKLGLALFSDTPFLLLDEPTSNLDESNKKWFFENLNLVKKNRIVVIASNEKEEIALSSNQISL